MRETLPTGPLPPPDIDPVRPMQFAGLMPGETLRRRVAVSYVLTGLIYLSWRPFAFNDDALVYSLLFYLAELYGFLLSIPILYTLRLLPDGNPQPPAAGLSVAVFIPTYREPVVIVRRTALAAMEMHYPHETWLLDDGDRPEMRALADELGCLYLARKTNENAKGGNLNHALQRCRADFIALLDCDHVPERNFLVRLLGYFRDPAVAFVQTPQDYYNVNAFQYGTGRPRRLLWHEQTFFHYVDQPGRGTLHMATLCGCSAIVRRAALDRIGGFACGTVTEDMHTAVKLQKLGYKSVYHPEPLAFGIAEADYGGFLRQRLRWGEGNLQVCRIEGLPFTRELTMAQRIAYFILTAPYLQGWYKLAIYIAPILTLLAGVSPISAPPEVFLPLFASFYIAGVFFLPALGRGLARTFATECMIMARFTIALYATLGYFRRRIGWRLSTKSIKGRIPPLAVLPLLSIALASIASIVYFVHRSADAPADYLPLWLGLLISSWGAMNAVVAVLVLANAVRCGRLSDTDYQFPLELPAIVRAKQARGAMALTTSVSSVRIEFRLPADAEPILEHPLELEIFLPHASATCGLGVERVTRRSESDELLVVARPVWRRQADRDKLDLTLISSKWHRRWLGQSEWAPTILDRLIAFLSRGRMPLAARAWRPILHRSADGTGEWCFGLLERDAGPGDSRIRLFEPLPAGSELRLLAFDGGRASERTVRLGPVVGALGVGQFHREQFASYDALASAVHGPVANPEPRVLRDALAAA